MDSARLRLEVAILAAEDVAPAVAPSLRDDGRRLTVMAVAVDTDVRWYVNECLRNRQDIRVIAAATVAEALTLAAHEPPALMVVDAPQSEMLMALPHLATIMIVDDVPRRDRRAGATVRFLGRPFSADALNDEVNQLLLER